ncbi:hypothetical protein ACFL6Y_09545 [Elusimicrobiota bacterium]
MKSILTFVFFAGSLIPSLAWSAPQDVTAIKHAAVVMGECARLADKIAVMKVPGGLARVRAAEFTNKQVGGDLISVNPAGAKFIKQMDGNALRMEECGKTYKAALKDSENLIEKLQKSEPTGKDADTVAAAMAKYVAAMEKLEKSMDKLSTKEDIQPYVAKPILQYFLGDAQGQAEMSVAGARLTAAAPESSAPSGFDAALTKELREIHKKQTEQLKMMDETKKKEKVKSAQALKELDARHKEDAKREKRVKSASMSTKKKKTTKKPLKKKSKGKKSKSKKSEDEKSEDKKSEDPLSRSDTQKVMQWIADGVASARQPYCYKESYGRGVGAPVSACSSDKDKDGWLCYPKCKTNYNGVGPVCWQKCPSNYTDTGAFCHIKKPLTKKGTWKCSWRLFGKCMMKKLSCPKGYAKAGLFCALKTPSVPSGYKGLSGLDLVKKSYGRGAGSPMTCATRKQYDAGLCYTPCKKGHNGVGPVCWMVCPKTKTECAAGCADTTISCITNTAQMVISPAMLALNIASAGGTSSMTKLFPQIVTAFKAGSAGIKAGETVELWITEYSKNFAKLTSPEIAAALHAGCRGRAKAEEWLKKQYALQALSLMLENDLGETGKNTLAMVSNFDPTGVTGVVSAYLHPVCSYTKAFPKVTF